jgi:hypothetical protein
MDTTTVLEIIKMIDAGFDNLDDYLHDDDLEKDECRIEYIKGGMHQLSSLKNHLQEFIDGQVNVVENQSAEQ